MARIRTIKPEFWSSPVMAGLDPWVRLLYIAMWNWADDSGRGTAIPKELGSFAFPNDDDISAADVRRMLGGVRRAFGVVFYEVDGRPYYYIPTWDKHQKIDKRSLPRYPGPEQGTPWNPDPNDDTFNPADQRKQLGSAGSTGDSAGSAEDPPSTPGDPGAGSRNRGTGEVGTGEQNTSTSQATQIRPAAKCPASYDDDAKFLEFWSVFPRRDGKAPAFKTWQTVTKTADPDVIIAGARRYAARERARGTRNEKIKMAQGWLNDRRWEDEPVAAVASQNGGHHVSPADARLAEGIALAAKLDAQHGTGAANMISPPLPGRRR